LAKGSKDVSAVYELLYNPDYTPRSSPGAHIESLTVDGKSALILMKESEGEYYEVDPTTHAIWRLLDGKRTLKEIFEEVKQTDGKLTEKDVRDTVVSLAEEGIIESTETEVRKGRIEVFSAFQLNVRLIGNASKSFVGLFRLTRKLIRKPELPIAVAITAIGFALFFATFARIFANPSLLQVAGSALLGFFFYQLLVLLPVYAVHELAHASVCDYYGGKPGEMGTGLYYLAPFFYCDTSDAWRLPRRARIMISVAGPLSTVVIASLFVFASFFVSGYPRDLLQIAAFFGFYGSLMNLSPVIETDGYYILADVIGIPNLRDEAFSYMKRTFLAIIGRPVRTVRQSTRHRRIVAVYSIIALIWLAFFAYTTAWIMGIYSSSAFLALLSMGQMALGLKIFDLTAFGVNLATLAYFALFVAGFVVMGGVAYKKIRMKGVKLETIHDKRVSTFLPLPSDLQRSKSEELVKQSRKLAQKYSHFSSVTLEPPFCVAELRLGRVDQSLEAMWDEMGAVEDDFRSLHRGFIGGALAQRSSSSKGEMIRENLFQLAGRFPGKDRQRAVSSISQFVRTQDERVGYVLQAAFGTVWTLEVSPDDYKRIRKGMFSSLIAGDLSINDLPSRVEDFKVRRVLGLDAMSRLSTEIEAETREVYRNPEVYQTTVFLEPVKSRLVFVGRTDKVEGSVVWLGGLYLYQAWTSYIGEALQEAAIGLKSIRLSHPASLTKTQVAKLHDDELAVLGRSLKGLEAVTSAVLEAVGKIESTTESSMNFHEMLEGLVTDGSFDVGLYKPILAANEEHLKGVKEKIGEFKDEFEWVSKRLAASKEEITTESASRASVSPPGQNWFRRLRSGASRLWSGESRDRTQAYDTEIKLIFATTRLVYGIVLGSDVIV
jgi:hypothetical protein